ncbi:NAD-dependent epimerase/dehydratase family protein [Sorangium sp. So ce145]|uniref:NAD-dependent epimerase/dehydratase family protein n=1 Tax=Sorangium sp. So ce145 TaxID=3133285 RepID=UPI003F5ED78C
MPSQPADSIRYDHPVAVIGGAGFVGSEAVRQLLAAGAGDVRVIDCQPLTGALAESPAVRAFRRDIRTDDLCEPLRGVKTVLHLAACQYHSPLAPTTYDLPFHAVNVEGTRRVLAASIAEHAARLVFVSTNMVYGLPQALPIREDHPKRPFGPYGRGKLEAEALIRAAHDEGRIDAAVIRPCLIVGPGRTGVLTRVLEWILRDRPVALIGGGRNRYQMVAVEDCARLVLLAGLDRGFAAYNCGSSDVPPMRRWVEEVARRAGSRSRVVNLPGALVKPALAALEAVRLSPLRKDQYLIADLDYIVDTTAARARLGWVPRYNDVDAALQTFAWYIEHRNTARAAPVAS